MPTMNSARLASRLSSIGVRLKSDRLRLGLLASALILSLVPVYQFVGSMLWYGEYLGDYKVFWGVTKIPTHGIYDHRAFAYPPTALLLILPFGLLPFWPSLVAWSAAGVVAIGCSARRIASGLAVNLGFLSFAAIGVVLGGQISLFVGALVIAGLSSVDPRWRGALLAAAAVIKPQSVLAAPVALIARRDWTAIAWAVLAACALVALSAVLFGPELWLRWLRELPRFHSYLSSLGIDQTDVGIYGLARASGLPGWTFLLGVPLGAATSWLVFETEAPSLDRYAAFAVSSVLLSPYTLYYDLAGLTFACVALLLDRERSPLIWLAAAMIVSSVLANVGIVLMGLLLALDARRQRIARAAAPGAPGAAPASIGSERIPIIA
jgi:hypothetical protein